MSERLENYPALGEVAADFSGRVSVLEALASESTAISPDLSNQSSVQGNADYDDQ